jgi:uncharacterized protein YdeI (YjbR/CyaY-like superfamily)
MQISTLSQVVPSELADALRENVEGRELFNALPPERQQEYIRQIAAAKKSKTRLARARKCLMALLEKVA